MEDFGLCSCCLELVCTKNLWTEYVWLGQTEVYGVMFKECFNVTWPKREDKENNYICDMCIINLRAACSFKKKVLDNQIKLANLAQSKENNLDIVMKNEVANEEEEYDSIKGDENEDSNDMLAMKSESIDIVVEEEFDRLSMVKGDVVEEKKTDDAKPSTSVNIPVSDKKSDKEKAPEIRKKSGKFVISINRDAKPEPNSAKEAKKRTSVLTVTKEFPALKKRKEHPKININSASYFKPRQNGSILLYYTTLCPFKSIKGYDFSDGKYRCYICKADFLFFKTLAKHMNEHNANHVCEACGKCFALPGRLASHMRFCISSNKPYKCEDCDKVLSSKGTLYSHIRYAHKNRRYTCSLCNETFKNYSDRLKHLADVHGKPLPDMSCKFCFKNFKTTSAHNIHIRKVHLKIPQKAKYGCDDCGKLFVFKYSLDEHYKTHSGERNFECRICSKKYPRAKSLREHMKIHLNDRRWVCDACDQKFVQKCSLKNHIRVHHPDMDLDKLIVYKKPEV